jgi:hypothetical protein
MKSPTKELRDERVTFRLTPGERANLSALAAKLQVKESTIIRDSLQPHLLLAEQLVNTEAA